MVQNIAKLFKLSGLYGTFAKPSLALQSVTSRTGKGVYASSDTLYKGAVFGRDSLEVAEDLLTIKPRLVRAILLTLASLQGTKFDRHSEEEPGKIVHEFRTTTVDGKAIDDESLYIFRKLSAMWGGSETEMAYYGSVDATPHFLRVLGRFCEKNGMSILEDTVTMRDGSERTLRDVTRAAADWLEMKLTSSSLGLVEYKKVNPHGISNQVWKDSEEFYVHDDGRAVNHEAPIASIEVQGLTYDGLRAAANLLDDSGYIDSAKRLKNAIFKDLWLPTRHYFAVGIDYGLDQKPRTIEMLAANQGALLDTALFDDLPEEKRHTYLSAIVSIIMSPDFLTDAGIRSRALSRAHLVDHWDYHGSYVSWPKETYDIAKGLRRQGFPILARQLENRILNVCLSYKAYPEFVYVDAHGRVLASPPSSHSHGDFTMVDGTNQPERVQAWTVSAVIAIVAGRLKNRMSVAKQEKPGTWQMMLERTIYAHIPHVDAHFNPTALQARYPIYPYKVKPRS